MNNNKQKCFFESQFLYNDYRLITTIDPVSFNRIKTHNKPDQQ